MTRLMKCTVLVAIMSILLIGCSLFKDDELPVSLKLSASSEVYKPEQKITVTATITGGAASKEIWWKIDDKNYEKGAEAKEFGPFADSSRHIVRCSVSSGANNAVALIALKSTADNTLQPVQRYGRLQVIDANLCDEYGKPVQLRGMSTHGIQYFPEFCNENMVNALANDWNADIIRVSCYVNEGDVTYLENPTASKKIINDMVQWAEKYGIYVLIDWHMLTPGDPNVYVSQAKAFWEEMVKLHGGKKHVLFDICNEPNNEGGADWAGNTENIPARNVTWDVIKEYADQIMPIIRAKSQNVAIVGTPNWASSPSAVIGSELDYPNVMYTMHFYAASHGQDKRNDLEKAVQAGIPVFVTEFGTQLASGDGMNNFVASATWLDLLNKYQISWCNWNISNDFRSGAVFQRFVNDKDRLIEEKLQVSGWSSLTQEERTQYWNAEEISYSSVADYSNSNNLKESGIWIKEKIQNR